jgi:uncharacterized Zn-binding protein involved in type VI secretion
MPKSAARKGDAHQCHKHDDGKIQEGSATVFINNQPAARVGDTAKCGDGQHTKLKQGSTSVTIDGKPAVRQDDPTDHDGKVKEGSSNVFIGDGGKPVQMGGKGKVLIGNNGKQVVIGK